MTAMSWNSSTEKPDRPVSVWVMSRSLINCRTMAVEESASAMPMISADCQARPASMPMPKMIAVVAKNWAPPRPSKRVRSRHNSARLQFEPDQEQHHDDAEFGEMQDRAAIGDETDAVWADQDAGDEIAEHGAEPGQLGRRHHDDGGGDENEDRQEQIGFHQNTAPLSMTFSRATSFSACSPSMESSAWRAR